MLRKGPIPFFAHGILEYLVGAFLIAAPLLLDYESGAATALSIGLGVVFLIVAASTAGPTSLINELPMSAHVMLDYVLAVFLIASPYLFDFSKEGTPTAGFIALGVIHLLVTIGTVFVRPTDQPAPPKPARGKT